VRPCKALCPQHVRRDQGEPNTCTVVICLWKWFYNNMSWRTPMKSVKKLKWRNQHETMPYLISKIY
jgi:hypothetical protein